MGLMTAEKRIRILGIDPGFGSLGWGLIEAGAELECLGAGVIRTKPDKTEKKCDDNLNRCAYIAERLAEIHDANDFAFIACEAQSWTRFANADRAVAMAFGVLGAVAHRYGCPIIQIRPQDVKKILVGKLTASKEEVQALIESRAAHAGMHLAGLPKTQQNHAADALAVALASLTSPLIKTVRRMA